MVSTPRPKAPECKGFSERDFHDGKGKVPWCLKKSLTGFTHPKDHDFYVKWFPSAKPMTSSV